MTLVTYTGRIFNYDNITKEDIHIPDILHSLPRINRFIGHSSRPYSVGEHTFLGLIMAEKLQLTPIQRLHWFKHDFTEAYVGDCPTPLKKLIPKFKEIEKEVESAIEKYLGLPPMTEEEKLLVKRIDNTMLVLEMRDLTLHDYNAYVNKFTYLEMLDDDDFNISGRPLDDRVLANVLEKLYNNLMEEIEIEEIINANINDERRFEVYMGSTEENMSLISENEDLYSIEEAETFIDYYISKNPSEGVVIFMYEEAVDENG